MLELKIIDQIRREVQKFWDGEVTKDYFITAAQGKEIGHRIADLVDDKSTGLLATKYLTKYQRDRRGEKLPRSMGDIWLEHKGIYHPVNVKTGVSAANGQPNMVSLKKLLDALLQRQIDSYYLLIVKFEIQKSIKCTVSFLDMLDHLEYVTFDSGPGQIMLKANAFYAARAAQTSTRQRPIKEKIDDLLELLEDGERRLAANRKAALIKYRSMAKQYATSAGHFVTPETQQSLHLL